MLCHVYTVANFVKGNKTINDFPTRPIYICNYVLLKMFKEQRERIDIP